MKQLVCEMCGSTNLIKQDGVFVCQSCGCKYSVEEAKKMMVEGVVEIKGSVTIDRSNEVSALVKSAELALSDLEASVFIEKAIKIDPSNGELYWRMFLLNNGYLFKKGGYRDIFYSRHYDMCSNGYNAYPTSSTIFDDKYYKKAVAFADEELKRKIQTHIDTFLSNAMYFDNGGIKPLDYILRIKNALPLFKENVVFYDENKLEALSKQVNQYLEAKAAQFKNVSDECLDTLSNIKLTKYGVEILDSVTDNSGINSVHKTFHRTIGYEEITSIYEKCTRGTSGNYDQTQIYLYGTGIDTKKYATSYVFQLAPPNTFYLDKTFYQYTTFVDEIVKRISLYTGTEFKNYRTNYSKSGCYVATCVYGSYDCPQVWTFRRFRDDTLGSTWYGRAFIRTYYAISPTLVKWFGNTNWFKNIWRGTLDKMVNLLKTKGVEDTPYKDKEWRK